MDSMPVREGLFDEKDGGRLLANRCSACGRTFFPKAEFCFDCLAEKMEDIVLSRQGTLYAYTIGRLPSTHFKPPYVVGLVDLPEGIRVFAPADGITGCDLDGRYAHAADHRYAVGRRRQAGYGV